MGHDPLVICDIAHNEAGIEQVVSRLNELGHKHIYFILGMVKDKAIDEILGLLPKHAHYIFAEAALPRALSAEDLSEQAARFGLQGTVVKGVNQAIAHAKNLAGKEDIVFIGGSAFLVAEIEGL